MKKIFSLVAVMLFTLSITAQKVLVSDAAHSRIQFSVIHLGINDITGNMDKAALTINADEKSFENSTLTFEADPSSINTHIEARDNHLKSADFFDVATYPTMVFSSTSLKRSATNKNYYELNGNLLLHGVTKPVTLTLIYRGSTLNNKKTTHGYQVLGTIKRSDFGVGSKFPEAMISDLVRIKGDFELTEK